MTINTFKLEKYLAVFDPVDVFCDRLVKQRGVLLMPASIYEMQTNHFRIGFGRKAMPDALHELTAFLNGLAN